MKSAKPILIRITTVPLSLDKLLGGQLRFMSDHFRVIAISSEKEYLERIGKKENVEVFHLEMTRKITPVADLVSVIKLYLYLRKIKPSIVHSHTPKAGIVAMLAARLAGVPHRLHTVAGLPLLEAKGSKRKVLDYVEKLTYSCATGIYPNSFGLYDIILKNRYCDKSKLKVIGKGSSNGIDTNHFSPDQYTAESRKKLRADLGISEVDFVFIFVGRLVADKGINELVGAFRKVKGKYNAVKLLLVGGYEQDLNPLKSETMDWIESDPSVISVGFQNDVRPYFAISDALVFPSYREGFPNVVLQAGAMGLPSVVSNINGCNEIIEDRKNGLIVSVKNEPAIVDAMDVMLSDTQLFNTMKMHSRQHIVENYGQAAVWQAILDEYRQLDNRQDKNV